MAKRKLVADECKQPKGRKALTPEARENQLIAYAMNLAEEHLRNGTASSQEIIHFLRLGTQKEKLEREKLLEENKLLRAKTSAVQSSERSEALYKEAIKAFRGYSGADDNEGPY